VAIKVSRSCDVTLKEGALLKFLSPSEYLVGFFECGTKEGNDPRSNPPFVYIVMEYMDMYLQIFITDGVQRIDQVW